MKAIDILTAFEIEINKIDDDLNKPITDDSIYWLNQAVLKFMKERFNGNLPHRTSYEQNEKRTRDLHNLYERTQLSEDGDKPEWLENRPQFRTQMYHWPNTLMYILNEDVTIENPEGEWQYDTSVFECTADNFMYRITNSLTDFHYKNNKARPLRIRIGKNDEGGYDVALLNDGKYSVQKYWISYLRYPEQITTDNSSDYNYKDFEDDVWHEIIKIAAQMYIENQADNRYQTITNEVLTQE